MPSLNEDFVFKPLPALETVVHFPFPQLLNPLGPLQDLGGTWGGKGFNTIWRPNFGGGSDHFLELNLTNDQITFDAISGPIPNRGLLQKDMNMFGLTYMQQISDANVGGGLHMEPGIWATVPATSNPNEVPTVVRMASIPHGTTILAQGTATTVNGKPNIPPASIKPFFINQPNNFVPFTEEHLNQASAFRSSGPQIAGITQAMLDDPNSVLRAAIANQTILHTTVLQVTTHTTAPMAGGGTANTAFLVGAAGGPNAVSAQVTSTFWIETVQGSPNFLQLQYSQVVMLNFATLSWPHVTVGTLVKHVPVKIPIWKIDPDLTKVGVAGPAHVGPGDPVEINPAVAHEINPAIINKVATPAVAAEHVATEATAAHLVTPPPEKP